MLSRGIVAGVIAATLMFAGSAAKAADLEPPPAESGWTFMMAPYLWGSGIDGEVGLKGLPAQDVDVSFGDIIKHLDIGFMGVGEARNGPFSLGLDLVYAKLSADIDTPRGLLATSIDAEVETFMGTAVAGYSVIYNESVTLDLVAGARLWSVDNDFDFNGGALNNTSVSDGATWVDPVVGAKLRADLGSDFYVAGWGLIGGFDVSSDLMWDVMGGVGYKITDSMSLFAGYRAMGVEFKDNGFVYDIVQDGPLLGATFQL